MPQSPFSRAFRGRNRPRGRCGGSPSELPGCFSFIPQTTNRRFRTQMSSPLSLFEELTTSSLPSRDGFSSTSFRDESNPEISVQIDTDLSEKFQLQKYMKLNTYLATDNWMVFFLRLRCLQHGDSWHNNFVFHKARDVVKVAIVDWQVGNISPLLAKHKSNRER